MGVIFGGRSGEHEVAVRSARSVIEAADADKYELIPVAIFMAAILSIMLFAGDDDESPASP